MDTLLSGHSHRGMLERKKNFKRNQQKYDILQLPTPEERIVIHDLFLQHKKGVEGNALKDTRFDSTQYMHPREQNIHGHIFGGYLMREAFELAFLTACTFAHQEFVQFLVMDEIEFLAPVRIGQILNCSALVTYTDPFNRLIQVAVRVTHVASNFLMLTDTAGGSSCYQSNRSLSYDYEYVPIYIPFQG